jgi:radical SAM superfamily enzyme YgiQ (UPF0313 family)
VRALLIDLNNFSRYPTLPVGLIVAILRRGGIDVDVLSPLARGVKGYPRPQRETVWGLIDNRLRYWSAVSRSTSIRRARRLAARVLNPGGSGDRSAVLRYLKEMLESPPDVVLISAYTMYEDMCRDIAAECRALGVPVVVGGNYFVLREIVERWLRIDGISVVYGGEPETHLVALLHDLVAGRDVTVHPGASVPGRPPASPALPLQDLDTLPFPDYSDFPWALYPNRILPIMTARGCGWGRCRFCSDVITSAGRTFRSRSLENVLAELTHQRARHETSLFVFLDLKLNSDLRLWRGLGERLPAVIPDASWTASVHVDSGEDNGLSRDDLIRAKRAGLARITTGLESASERLLKRMAKGSSLPKTSQFIRDAAEAGIGVRLTTITGYPGEEPDDIERTTQFLLEHSRWIERVVLNMFQLKPGTDLDKRSLRRGTDLPGMRRGSLDAGNAVIPLQNAAHDSRSYRRAVYRLMGVAHQINRRPMLGEAREFAGVM